MHYNITIIKKIFQSSQKKILKYYKIIQSLRNFIGLLLWFEITQSE